MKPDRPERFRRTKSVLASSAIAVVVAALTMGLSSLVFGPTSASPEHVGFGLASDPSSFTITSNIYPSPACSGTPALLYPGTPRCAVFTVKNLLNVPITVRSITTWQTTWTSRISARRQKPVKTMPAVATTNNT